MYVGRKETEELALDRAILTYSSIGSSLPHLIQFNVAIKMLAFFLLSEARR